MTRAAPPLVHPDTVGSGPDLLQREGQRALRAEPRLRGGREPARTECPAGWGLSRAEAASSPSYLGGRGSLAKARRDLLRPTQ